MRKRRKLNENWFAGGNMSSPGMDWGMSPATYMVQGGQTGYTYAIRGLDDTLQQKPNTPPREYYIHPGCSVSGVGINNPDKKYSGKVYRILKDVDGSIIGLYILSFKTSKFVSIRADEYLTLLIAKAPDEVDRFSPIASHNVDTLPTR